MARQRGSNSVVAALPGSAHAAGLRYATDNSRGISRRRSGKGFVYFIPSGRLISDASALARIRALAIPPAWTDVWISPDPNAHLQATGRDARRRKQYRYHARWRVVRHQAKYDRMLPFARALPQIRRHVGHHLRQTPLTRDKVVAVVVQLLEKTLIRVGNIEYVRANRSFGLTTLRDQHVRVRGAEVRFGFRGKSGIRQSVVLSDQRLARIVKRCQDLPGQELFQYIDDEGVRHPITSADVNGYLRRAAGADFTAKDFRTWAGTLLAAGALREVADQETLGRSVRRTRATITRAIETVARHLGNTSAVCRACYVHPAVLEAYADGTLVSRLASSGRLLRRGLSAEETAVLGLLESRRRWPDQLASALRAARASRRSRAVPKASPHTRWVVSRA